MLRLLFVFFIAVVFTACGTNDPKKLALKAEPLVSFQPSIKLDDKWSEVVSSGQDERYARLKPAVLDGNLYVAGIKGDVSAFNAETGKRLWKTKTGIEVAGGVGVSNGAVLFGSYDGYVHALDRSSGAKLWSVAVSSEVVSAPVGSDSLVVAVTIDGSVFALDAKTGEKLWSYDHPVPVLSIRGTASPVLTPSQVIVAFDSGQIVSLSASDGSPQWDFRVSRPQGRTELDRIVDIDGTPVLSGGYIYAASFQGNVVAASRGNGRVMWTKEASTANAVVVENGKVFVATEESRLIALNATSGALEWENFQLKRRNISAPVVVDGYLFVVDAKGYMHGFSAEDGTMAFRSRVRTSRFTGVVTNKFERMRAARGVQSVQSPLTSDSNTLYVLADSGRLTAYTVKPLKDQ